MSGLFYGKFVAEFQSKAVVNVLHFSVIALIICCA